jgi:phosphopantetheinyl transferase
MRSLDERPAMISIACTRREAAAINRRPQPQQDRAFLSIWTAKEAVLKCMGLGLSVDPRAIEIHISGQHSEVTYRPEPCARWTVRRAERWDRDKIVVAVAVAGSRRLRVRWQPARTADWIAEPREPI